jgi:hypothetical protein
MAFICSAMVLLDETWALVAVIMDKLRKNTWNNFMLEYDLPTAKLPLQNSANNYSKPCFSG